MKKIKTIVISIALLMGLLPSMAMATTYNNEVPSGLTLQYWSINPNQGGKQTSINFVYSGGFSVPMGIKAPFDSSWRTIDDVRPILLAEQEGYGNYLGGTNGTFGSNIKFSSNVLAAMKDQNFNPSQVGGADIPPSSPAASDQTSSSSSTDQTQSQSSQPTATTQASTSTKTGAAQGQASPASSAVQSEPVGKTVQTASGPMTQQTVAENQKLVAENPPSTNPANIPKASSTQANSKRNLWIEVVAGVVVLVIAGIVGRVIYIKRKLA